ncbi:hypothetical protein EJB05_24306, partial [Eragrostis curvula]
MGSCSTRMLLMAAAVAAAILGLAGSNFSDDVSSDWAPQNVRFTDNGRGVSLQLDRSSGSRIKTRKPFMHGTLSTLVQLVPGDSAGVITTFYTSSEGRNHDEIDFEFLGNAPGRPYTIHTNIFVADIGNREVQFKAWFHPADGYHNYTISWTCIVVWYVDGFPIRQYKKSQGVAFPSSQPMSGYMSIWASEDAWATQGGRVRTDWSKAPFTSKYRDLQLQLCNCSIGGDHCQINCPAHAGACQLSKEQEEQMHMMQEKYMLYNYCRDSKRFNGQMPIECK